MNRNGRPAQKKRTFLRLTANWLFPFLRVGNKLSSSQKTLVRKDYYPGLDGSYNLVVSQQCVIYCWMLLGSTFLACGTSEIRSLWLRDGDTKSVLQVRPRQSGRCVGMLLASEWAKSLPIPHSAHRYELRDDNGGLGFELWLQKNESRFWWDATYDYGAQLRVKWQTVIGFLVH